MVCFASQWIGIHSWVHHDSIRQCAADSTILNGWSLALIGNASGRKRSVNSGQTLRGIFDKETRRKPLVFAADAGLWGLNRLSPVINRIYDSCRNGAKVKKANENENVRLRHDSRSLTR